MPEPKFTTKGGSAEAQVEDVKGTHATARVRVILSAVVPASVVIIISVALIVAIIFTKEIHDLTVSLLVLLSTVVSGYIGYSRGKAHSSTEE